MKDQTTNILMALADAYKCLQAADQFARDNGSSELSVQIMDVLNMLRPLMF